MISGGMSALGEAADLSSRMWEMKEEREMDRPKAKSPVKKIGLCSDLKKNILEKSLIFLSLRNRD